MTACYMRKFGLDCIDEVNEAFLKSEGCDLIFYDNTGNRVEEFLEGVKQGKYEFAISDKNIANLCLSVVSADSVTEPRTNSRMTRYLDNLPNLFDRYNITDEFGNRYTNDRWALKAAALMMSSVMMEQLRAIVTVNKSHAA